MSNLILVTGGTGMIGRYLVPLLIESGNEVIVASLDGKDCATQKLNSRN